MQEPTRELNQAREPLPPLTFEQTNQFQVKLIERHVFRGGTEMGWVEKYAAKFRELVTKDEAITYIILTDPETAVSVVEEALEGDEEI